MKDYKNTLNLPSTEFPMRASLPVKEPETLKKWNDGEIYKLIRKKNAGKKTFILHDGPPFSNGNIHMGTAMNKVLKDLIVKYKSMTGFDAPYVPGWDNHGMPIESAIIKKNKLDRKKMTIPEFRRQCEEFAANFVDIQRTSFRRLGVFGDWDDPYLTMAPSFEANEIKIFGEMFKKGYIYKGLKPVYWCPKDETALAEAEIEYKDAKCTSIYVRFKVKDDLGKLDGICDKDNTYFIIWTTTPWTMPGNMAIALHPRETYVIVKAGDVNYILAAPLADRTMKQGGIENYEIIKEVPGSFFELMTAYHPFLDRDSLICSAEYVTMDSGTGCVHTAPGFGADDYYTGMRYGIKIVVPVDDRGYQTADAGKFAGMYYEESNKAILDDMKESGALFASEEIVHQYPHCWRCKNPIIFRATPQWFCSVEAFRDKAIAACGNVDWLPAWGGDRMVSMIRERADWCISRQRHWGLPIPAFYCKDCGEIICTEDTINKVSEIFGKEGSNAWFEKEASELLPEGFVCPKCGGVHFTKETDTLDGWFDSGSTHFNVLSREGLSWPADLYLEGADQYRGWFQSSLLTAVGAKDAGAPYKQVLTHGWVVDGEGKAMHKSLGNSVAPEEIIVKYGADMLRLWVAASDYRVDVRASDEIFKQLSESYRKIRNTLRILLANIGDFDPDKDAVGTDKFRDIDKWLISRLNKLVKTARQAYEDYEFHIVYHELHNFCSIDLSKIYVDITKDRMYCDKSDSDSRRAAQTVMYESASALIRLLAPILSYTAEEAWGYLPHKACEDARSVFLNDIPEYIPSEDFSSIEEGYDKLFEYRDTVLKALEEARTARVIGKSLDADVIIGSPEDNEAMKVFASHKDTLAEIFITSKVELTNGAVEDAFTDEVSGLSIKVLPASGDKCVRCWKSGDGYDVDEEGGHLCERCKNAVC